LLLVETSLTLSKAIQNLIINIEKIIHILDVLIDNMSVLFSGEVLQQMVSIPMGTNCAPLLANLFLHAYEADFLQGLLILY
jgi:hypothetical protein